MCLSENDSFFIFGGFDGNSDLKDLYSFNLNNLTWTLIDCGRNLPQKSSFHSMVAIKDKELKLYLYGGLQGSDTNFKMFDTLFEYKFESIFSQSIFKNKNYKDVVFVFQ
jgi:hypothetical protein